MDGTENRMAISLDRIIPIPNISKWFLIPFEVDLTYTYFSSSSLWTRMVHNRLPDTLASLVDISNRIAHKWDQQNLINQHDFSKT